MKSRMMKMFVFVVVIVTAMLVGIALQARTHGRPTVSSRPLYCYQQKGKMMCFDSANPGQVRCTDLDRSTVYCSAE